MQKNKCHLINVGNSLVKFARENSKKELNGYLNSQKNKKQKAEISKLRIAFNSIISIIKSLKYLNKNNLYR